MPSISDGYESACGRLQPGSAFLEVFFCNLEQVGAVQGKRGVGVGGVTPMWSERAVAGWMNWT